MRDHVTEAFARLDDEIVRTVRPAGVDAAIATARRRHHRRLGAVAGVGVLLVGSFAWWAGSTHSESTPHPAEQPTVIESPEPEPASAEKQRSTTDIDGRCMEGAVLCVDKSDGTLRWVVDGTVIVAVDVRVGCLSSPTREGVFSVYWKSRDHVSSLYDMQMPFAMFFGGGQAVHHAEDSSTTESGCSPGGVIVLDRDTMAWLFDQVEVGDTVVIYQGRG